MQLGFIRSGADRKSEFLTGFHKAPGASLRFLTKFLSLDLVLGL